MINGVIWAVLNLLGKIAVLNDRLARRVTIGAKASPHDLSSDVGMKSSGDYFLDIVVSNRRTSSTVTGANDDNSEP